MRYVSMINKILHRMLVLDNKMIKSLVAKAKQEQVSLNLCSCQSRHFPESRLGPKTKHFYNNSVYLEHWKSRMKRQKYSICVVLLNGAWLDLAQLSNKIPSHWPRNQINPDKLHFLLYTYFIHNFKSNVINRHYYYKFLLI